MPPANMTEMWPIHTQRQQESWKIHTVQFRNLINSALTRPVCAAFVSCLCLQEEDFVNVQSSDVMVMWLEVHQAESQVSWAIFPVGSPAICVALYISFNSLPVHLKIGGKRCTHSVVRATSSRSLRKQWNVWSQKSHWGSKYSGKMWSEMPITCVKVQVSLYVRERQAAN